MEQFEVKARAILLGAAFLSIASADADAQTREQLQGEGEFVRTLIRARDAKDCRLQLRLIDERKTELRSQMHRLKRSKPAAVPMKSDGEAMYLAAQMEGLMNRRALVARECK
ncbi:hypothetical protein FPZ54_12980 [Sphingomonas suaedae]|uniref:Uncharacterized protein n=1 Tax=Sphingomonas suaedae TaxID=2599297 RepID=A0A518RH85_9SPHN|nr:hypothetical protein [Sphingomonas suaedae]QDX26828.1 hypothetical protein FPZ54_12980 [Sphingomonas suaedae]